MRRDRIRGGATFADLSDADPTPASIGTRPSAGADDARRREVARVMAMSPRERALLALRLGRRTRIDAALAARER